MSYTHEMSPYELQAVYEEAHYHQCISDIVSLMLEYGDEQVFGEACARAQKPYTPLEILFTKKSVNQSKQLRNEKAVRQL